MMRYLYISSKVQNRIEKLKKTGRAGTGLARKVTSIIQSLSEGMERHHMTAINNYTKYGEKRIKNCRKFDLSGGYRLITLQRGLDIYIPFLGTHDECQRWLKKNSRMKSINMGQKTSLAFPRKPVSLNSESKCISGSIDKNSPDKLTENLSDQDLRFIFSGLVSDTETTYKNTK